MNKKINLESIKNIISSIVKENSMTEEEIYECGAACSGLGTTTSDLGLAVQYIGDKKKEEDVLSEEDEISEMARGILAPQEIAKREYVLEFPNSGIKTSDQFLRNVINNPNAEGYDKYIKRLSYLIRNSDLSSFSNIAANIELDNSEESDDYMLSKMYADAILNHRKNMSKSSYDSKGTINAYQRNILKRGPYHKYHDTSIKQDIGKEISDKYNDIDPSKSNDILIKFFKSSNWEKLDKREQLKVINTIDNEADLDQRGTEIVNKVKNFILDNYDNEE